MQNDRRVVRAVFALSVVVFAAGPVAARAAGATPSPSPSPTPLHVIESVKVTGASASRRQQYRSSFSGSLIDRSDIKELGADQSMQTILSSKPSVEAFGFGGSPYVRTHFSFRGFDGGEFGETLDGIPLNGLFNGGVTNSASQRNATPFVTGLLGSVNIYRGVNDPQHTSIDSLGGSVAYHLLDPTDLPSLSTSYDVGNGGDLFWQTGKTPLFGTKFAIGAGSDYYRGFQSGVPDANRYFYANAVVPLQGRNFLRLIYSTDRNVGYVPHDIPLNGLPGNSISDQGIGFQWPATQTYSYNTADVNLAILDYSHGWSSAFTSRLTLFRYDAQYHRLSYSDPNYPYLPNSPFAPTFAQPWMNGTISSSAADFAFHLYRNGDQRLGFVLRNELETSSHNTVIFGAQYEHGYEVSQEYWGPTVDFQPLDTYNDAWNQPGYRNYATQYVEDKFQTGKLLINPGLRLDGVETADYTPVVGYFYSFPFAVGNSYHFTEPSLGARYAFSPRLTAYAGIGSSAKPPEIAAYYNDNQLVPGTSQIAPLVVQPERSVDLDVGLRGTMRGMYWTVDAYSDRFVDTFQTAPAGVSYFEGLGQTPGQAAASAASSSITLTTNGGDAVYHGVEVSLTHVPLGVRGLLGYFNFSQNAAAYTTAFPNGSGATVPVGTSVPYVPNHLWNFGIYRRGREVDWRLGEHVVGAQTIFDDVAGGPSNLTLSSYTSLDGFLSFKLDRSGYYRLNLTGTNLLDDQGNVYGYVSSSFLDANGNVLPLEVVMPQTPRSFFVSIASRFR